MKAILPILFIFVVSCTKIPFLSRNAEKTPEEVLRKFLKVSAEASDSKDKTTIQEMCHGEMKRIFERMSDEMFTMSYLSKQLELKGVEIVQSTVEKEVARLRYKIEVENRQGTDTTHETNEREVELTRVDGQWRIDSIRPVGSDQIAFSRGMVF